MDPERYWALMARVVAQIDHLDAQATRTILQELRAVQERLMAGLASAVPDTPDWQMRHWGDLSRAIQGAIEEFAGQAPPRTRG